MRRSRTFSGVFGLLLIVSLVLPAPLPAQEPAPPPGAQLTIRGDLRVEQPVDILCDLKGSEIPHDAYASIKVTFLDKPAGEEPTVRTGYPRTTIIFHQPGTYRLGFLLSEVTKGSCGGATANNLLEAQRELVITAK